MEQKGKILEVLPNKLFRVEMENGKKVIAHMAEQMRVVSVRLTPGDEVTVEVSDLNDNRARITAKRK